jgi:phage terminase large subunit-like protein
VRGRKAGFSDPLIEEKFVEFGRGTQSMSPALGELEEIVMEKELAHGNHPVLAMNVACSVVNSRDDANRKSSKNKSTGRIDGLVALAMAVGVTEKVVAKPFSFILTKTNSDDIPMARNGAFCQNGL